MKLTVIIPIFNEKQTCLAVIQQVKNVYSNTQIIVVDDGSTDGTTEMLQNINEIEVIHHKVNLGKGSAVKSAIPLIQGEYVILQDGDLETHPQDYPKLLEPLIRQEADAVFGSRWIEYKNSLTWHYIGNRILTFLSNIINGSHMTDMACCYKAIPGVIFRSLQIKSRGFGLEAEIAAKLFRKGCKIKEVPISYFRRTKKQGKKIRLKDGLVALWSCVRFRFWD